MSTLQVLSFPFLRSRRLSYCKSKDDDLREHTLTNLSDFKFKFWPNIFKTTLFFYSFAWPKAFHWFNIYNYMRDSGSCVHHCDWKIKPDHPCLYDVVYYKKTCYDWPAKFSTQYSICQIWHIFWHCIGWWFLHLMLNFSTDTIIWHGIGDALI